MDTIHVEEAFAGPPTIGHGGYVAGFFDGRWPGAYQVTLRRPTPLGTPLRLDRTEPDRSTLWNGDELIADAVPADLELEVPAPPTARDAAAAAPGSPSRFNDHGVHPNCFGCGLARTEGGLRIAAGPVDADHGMVAAVWTPGSEHTDDDGHIDRHMVVAALDCPGAFAFIVAGERAGLLGRLTIEHYQPALADEEHIVTGWRIDTDNRKLIAGTALFSPRNELVAAAKATWFPFPSR